MDNYHIYSLIINHNGELRLPLMFLQLLRREMMNLLPLHYEVTMTVMLMLMMMVMVMSVISYHGDDDDLFVAGNNKILHNEHS